MSSTTPTPTSASATTSTATSSCTSAIPDKNGHVPADACNSYYLYYPSFGAAVACSVLFGILTIIHIVQAYTFKKKYCWVLIMGSLWETASFITRSVSTRTQQNLALAIINQLLLLLAPLWINAFVYMTVGRLIHCFLPEKRVFKVKAASIGKYFVWLDILSFLVQGLGGAMLSPGSSAQTQKNGLNVYMGGVGLQQFFICLFIGLIVGFQLRRQEYERTGQVETNPKWKWLTYILYAVLAFISTRIIFRLIEFSRGYEPNNPLPYHEVYMYLLDAFPMFLAIVLLALLHPGLVLVGPDSEFPKLTRKEKKELKRQRKEEKRAKKEGNRTAKKRGKNSAYTPEDSSGFYEVELAPQHRAASMV